jgi:hypothetical protein
LASSHVGTPDPRQAHPPLGQGIIINFWIPTNILKKQHPSLTLDLLFRNYSQKKITYPLSSTWGYKVYKLLNEEFAKTGGLLTYKAEIVAQDGTVIKEWEHQLWVRLITAEDNSSAAVTPLSPEDQETPLDELEQTDTQESMDEQYFIPQEKSGDIYPEVYEDLPEGPAPPDTDAQP